MGPMYFASMRKIQIFGFRIDGVPEQLNFLIVENETIGKDGTMTHGPNSVLSMTDWAMQPHGIGELSCAIHADNCPGQNKNQYVLGYFMWRVMTARHEHIEYLMQIPGHARCLVDSGFATLKKLYRRSDVDSLDQLETVVNRSSTSNTAVRYPSWEWRDWKTFLTPVFRPIPGIRRYQYFRMSSAYPGVVYLKINRDAPETSYNILRRADFTFGNAMPLVIQPGGLSETRHQYLYKTVRPFVRPRFQDVTCPVIAEDL